jgi:hypothetical protein
MNRLWRSGSSKGKDEAPMKLTQLSRWQRFLVLLAVVPLSACSLAKLKSGPAASSNSAGESSVPSTAFSPSNDARKDLRDALRKLNSAYPYRLTETMSAMANGQIAMPESTRVVEFAAADRSHMKWTGGPGGNVEAISIGDQHYWFANGKWTEGTVGSSMKTDRDGDFAAKLAEMVKEVKYLGPENVNGVACYTYSFTMETTMAGQSYTGAGKLWLGAADGLPHQSDSEFKVANYQNKSHIVYEYNQNIKVEKPAM